MDKAERGTKRQCLKCGTKFYDLNNDPIVCPNCQAPFETAERIAALAEAKGDELDNDEVDVDAAAVEAGAEVVSFEDAEDDDADANAADEALADVADDVDDIGGEVDNSFIDDDDDDDDDDFGISVERRSDDE